MILVSAAHPAAAQTKFDEYPQIYTMTPTGVNLQSGLYVYTKEEFRIGALPFVRSYNGIPSTMRTPDSTGSFGDWSHNLAWSVRQKDQFPTALFGEVYVESKLYRFSFVTGNTWSPWDQDSLGTSLIGNTSGYTFVDKKGAQFTFGPASGRFGPASVQKVVYADGLELNFSYDASGNVRTVISSRGEAIVLDYSNGVLVTACGYNMSLHSVTTSTTCSTFIPEAKVSYSYTTVAGRKYLQSATYRDNRVVTMSYVSVSGSAQAFLSCQTLASTNTCEVANEYVIPSTGCCVVSKQTLPTGEVRTYNVDAVASEDGGQTWPLPPRNSFGEMTNPDSSRTTMEYNYGIPETLYDVTGITRYEWEGTSLTKVTYPGGNAVEMTRDQRANVLVLTRRPPPDSPDSATSVVQGFDADAPTESLPCATLSAKLCNKPLYRRDARGNQTDFSYNPIHGGVEAEIQPADSNGVRPVIRSAYVARTAWIANSGGGYRQAGPAIWLLSEQRTCRNGATNLTSKTCVNGASDEVITAYDYGPDAGPNLLLLRGITVTADGQTQRTCYGYDALGRKISETKPNANLGACP